MRFICFEQSSKALVHTLLQALLLICQCRPLLRAFLAGTHTSPRLAQHADDCLAIKASAHLPQLFELFEQAQGKFKQLSGVLLRMLQACVCAARCTR